MKNLVDQLLGGSSPESRVPSLSSKEALILKLLCEGGEMYGLQLVAQSHGELKRGTVYVTLGRMEDKGYIGSRQETRPEGAIGLPRRLYSPTARGAEVLRAWQRAALALAGLGGEGASS